MQRIQTDWVYLKILVGNYEMSKENDVFDWKKTQRVGLVAVKVYLAYFVPM